MTTINWDHVDHDTTREVLEGKRIDEDGICQALTFAMQCCQADQHNEDIPFEVLTTRGAAYEEADEWWNAEGNTEETVAALRRFWEN